MELLKTQLLNLSEDDWNTFVTPAACSNYYFFSTGGKPLYFKMDSFGFVTFP